MSKAKEEIKLIHLVCQAGMGDEYEVGLNGVTRIVEEEIFTTPHEAICMFSVYSEDNIVARISANTPFVLRYKEEEDRRMYL